MPEHTYFTLLLNLVFLGQVLLVSLHLPRKVLGRVQHLVQTYPPTQYPKLYATSIEGVHKAQRNYRVMNMVILGLGLAIFGYGLYSASEDILHLDSASVIMVYGLLQCAPLIVVMSSGFVYFNLKRKPDPRRTRRADLQPRRLLDFVSPVGLGLAALVNCAFVLFIVYFRRFDFPWFGGYLNIVGVTAMNLFFAATLLRALRGKPQDPYQTYDDRRQQIAIIANLILAVSVLIPLFVASNIGLRAVGWEQWIPIAQSLLWQALAILNFQTFRIDYVDFEVYREDWQAA